MKSHSGKQCFEYESALAYLQYIQVPHKFFVNILKHIHATLNERVPKAHRDAIPSASSSSAPLCSARSPASAVTRCVPT